MFYSHVLPDAYSIHDTRVVVNTIFDVAVNLHRRSNCLLGLRSFCFVGFVDAPVPLPV